MWLVYRCEHTAHRPCTCKATHPPLGKAGPRQHLILIIPYHPCIPAPQWGELHGVRTIAGAAALGAALFGVHCCLASK